MSTQIIFGKPINEYGKLLDTFSGTRINSIRTSSIPLVQFWKDHETQLQKLQEITVLPLEDVKLCFEYPTAPLHGKGKPSMTDLMILSESHKIAIEAKYTEYVKMTDKTVAKWLGQQKEHIENSEKVLSGWWDMIDQFRNDKKRYKDIGYQFLHRTASACFDTQQQVAVVYQVFYDDKTAKKADEYQKLLESYVQKINPNERLHFYIWKIKTVLKVDASVNHPFETMKRQNVYEFQCSTIYNIQ